MSPKVDDSEEGAVNEHASGAVAKRMKIRCTVVEGPLAGQVFEFEGHDTLMIGRGVKTGLKLTGDPAVSRHHCVLEFAPPRCHMRDLGSRNGTQVNGHKVEESEIRPGDRVRIGKTVLEISLPDSPVQPRVALARCARCGGETDAAQTDMALTGAENVICERCTEKLAKIPEVFPGYKVIRKLGEGGMGAVYLAADAKSNELVAVKTLRPQMAKDEQAVAMFLREALHGAQIDHPHAVHFLSSGLSHGLFYFLMEYIDGPDLQTFLKETKKPFQLQDALEIWKQVLWVLDHAHSRKLVHRDIKPSNIMLVRRPPDSPVTKLTDFGLMRRFESTGFSLITKTGEGKGTIAYMPPEQVEDAKHVGPAADLYSLASTIFYMLTLETPIEFKKKENKILAVLQGKPRALRTLLPQTPENIDALMARCLRKDPERRPQSAKEVLRALEE